MMVAPSIKIELPDYCTLSKFESLLRKRYAASLSSKRDVIFDFSKVQWIGPLQANLLYGWITSIASGRNVSVSVSTKNRGSRYLMSISFFAQLANHGVTVPKDLISDDDQLFKFFRVFPNKQEFKSYEEALVAPERREKLWANSSDLPLVKSGELQDILLRELVDNCFVHGEGHCVLFAVSEFPSDQDRKAPPILENFDCGAYLEVVASDSGPGLLQKLRLPETYEADIETACNLSLSVRTVAYAFEFASTGDEAARQERIQEILNSNNPEADFIASGLWYVMRLARKYGAQILVRTGTVHVSLNWYGGRLAISATEELPEVAGTHISFRCRRDGYFVRNQKQVPFPLDSDVEVRVLVLERIREGTRDDAEFLMRAQQEVQELLHERRAYVGKAVSTVVLCNGLHVDHKAFSLLLLGLSAMDRRHSPLLVAGLRTELFESATAVWQRILEKSQSRTSFLEATTYQSFGLVGDDLASFGNFGHKDQPESTVISDLGNGNANARFMVPEKDAVKSYFRALQNAISAAVEEWPIKHSGDGRYFLIENKYYTTEFFEIAKVGHRQSTSAAVIGWLAFVLRQQEVGSIFVIAEPLFQITRDVTEGSSHYKWFYATPGSDIANFFQAIAATQEGKKLLLLTDVICRANQFLRYLRKTNAFDKIIICALIDGRTVDGEQDYAWLTFDRPSGPIPIHIFSAKRHPIDTITDLPAGVDFHQVRIVDPRTHSPTTYDCLEAPQISSDDIVDYSVVAAAMVHGHFKFHGKHYQDFIFFGRLFPAMCGDLHTFWGNALADISATKKIGARSTRAYYLDEQRGWEHIVVNYLASSSLGNYQSLVRDDLDAPPDPVGPSPGEFAALWFILPAIANGETVRLCLEYAWRLKPQYIHVSITVGRLDSARLSFYQNITAYRGIPVKIKILAHIPLPASPSRSSCSLCEIESQLERVMSNLERHVELSRIVQDRKRLFRAIEISLQSVERGEVEAITRGNEDYVRVRMMIEQAPRSFEMRKGIGSYLDSKGDEGLRQLVEVVGEDFLSPRLTGELIDRATHSRFRQAEAFVSELFRNPNRGISLKLLLGCNRLFPNVLSVEFKGLFAWAIENECHLLAEDLVFCALLNPEKYAMPLLVAVSSITGRNVLEERLFADIKSHLWNALDADSQVGVFIDLFDFLRRSTEWGTSIDILLKQLRTLLLRQVDGEVMEKKLVPALTINLFIEKTMGPLYDYLSRLRSTSNRNSGGLWKVIRASNQDFESVINDFHTLQVSLQRMVSERSVEVEAAISCIKKAGDLGAKLKKNLGRLFTNPVDAKRDIEQLRDSMWTSNLRVDLKIAANQPGLLIERDDLKKFIVHVIDNADARVIALRQDGDEENYWLELCFGGVEDDGKWSPFLVRTNVRWDRTLVPSGGMKEFMMICTRYGAIYELSPDTGTDEYLSIRVMFRILEEGERHGH